VNGSNSTHQMSALFVASQKGHDSIVKRLLLHKDTDVNMPDGTGKFTKFNVSMTNRGTSTSKT
jgi:hypothetical protein